jgi:hypothetical protein
VPSQPAAVELLDRSGRVVHVSPLTTERVWTPPINVPVVRLRLRGAVDRVLVRTIARALATVSVETAVGGVHLRPAYEVTGSIRTAGIVLLEYALAGRVKRCNAVVIAPRVVLTNAHCIGSTAALAESYYPRVYPAFTSDATPGSEIRVTSLVDVDTGIDTSLLELASAVPDAANRVVRLATADPLLRAPLRVVQHYEPYGWSKVVSDDEDCRVLAIPVAGSGPNTDFLHGCDTEKGSSGTAVFAADGTVVGVHHWGRLQGQWNENKAARIARVWILVDHARTQNPTLQLPRHQ